MYWYVERQRRHGHIDNTTNELRVKVAMNFPKPGSNVAYELIKLCVLVSYHGLPYVLMSQHTAPVRGPADWDELDMDDWCEDEDSSSADDDEVGADSYVDREAGADWYVDRAEIEADWYVEPSPHGGRIDLQVKVLAENYRLSCRAADVAEVHEQVDQIRKRYAGHREAERNVAKAIGGLRARCDPPLVACAGPFFVVSLFVAFEMRVVLAGTLFLWPLATHRS